MEVTSKPDVGFYNEFSITIMVAAPMALLVSLVLLRIYRRAVMRTMQRRVTLTLGAAAGVLENRPARSGDPPGHSLQIMPHDAPTDDVRLAVSRARWPSAAVQVCAGLAYAIVMTSGWFVAGGFGFEWHVFLFMTIWFAWPIVITVGLAIAVSWRELALIVFGYALAFAGVAAPILISADVLARPMVTNWLWGNGLGTLLALAFLLRPIRAVGSLVLVFMIAAVAGAIIGTLSLNEHQQVLYWVYLGIFYGAALLLFTCAIATGIMCWLLLRWLMTGVTASQQLTNWLNANVANRIQALTLARPIITVIVLFVIAAVAGAIVIEDLFWDSVEQQTLLRSIISNLGVVGNVVLLVLAGAIPTGIIGWLLLRWLGGLYRRRQISDQSIIIDAVWLIFSLAQSPTTGPVSGSEVSFVIAIGAFVAYKLAATAGFRLLRTRAERDEQASKLLLLRVFSLGTRSERLFADFTKLWRYMGIVRMIAGPDLATSTVEPHEFLDFLAGRLQRRFITGPDTLEQRISETEQRRDTDSRFRVAEFFCHDDTWQMVLRRLEKDSDVVLMDLRGFSQSNRGCVFEINELLDLVLLRHIVFVVDRTTDENFLAQVFAGAWAAVTKASPNWNDPAPRIRLYRFDDRGGQNISALVAAVANAGMRAKPLLAVQIPRALPSPI
jgi:hypothetical protein